MEGPAAPRRAFTDMKVACRRGAERLLLLLPDRVVPALRRGVGAAPARRCSGATTAPGAPVGTAAKKKKDNYSDAQYGLKHGGSEESHAQQMNAMGSGRYAYLNDFYKDLNKGPVKLDFAEKPMSEKERQAEEARAESAGALARLPRS